MIGNGEAASTCDGWWRRRPCVEFRHRPSYRPACALASATRSRNRGRSHQSYTYAQSTLTLVSSFTLLVSVSSYGSVYKALDKRDGKLVAIKVLEVENEDTVELQKEINILKECDCEWIVRYKGSYRKDGNIWIVCQRSGHHAHRCTGFDTFLRRSLRRLPLPFLLANTVAFARFSAVCVFDPVR